MIALAMAPLVLAALLVLVLTRVLPVSGVGLWPQETRRALLAVTIGVAAVLYLHQGSYCTEESPDGRYCAIVRCNGLLLRAGVQDAELVIEERGFGGAHVTARRPLEGSYGLPVRVVWHPDGRRLACIRQRGGMPPHCEVIHLAREVAVR